MKRLLSVIACLAWWTAVQAAPATIDLSEGLSYLRIHSVGDDTLTLASSTAKALVVDVRHATASEETVTAFSDALNKRATVAQVFVLVSPDTPRVLTKTLEQLPAKTLTLGSEKSRPAPKVVVETTTSDDRAAYDAFESGTAIEKLVTGRIEKERYDEATLVKEFKNGSAHSEEDAQPAKPNEEKPAEKSAPTDRVLQRAVHIHRALAALRK